MGLTAGNYSAKIQDWGIKHYADKDEYKLFIKFEIENPPTSNEQYITWHGSLDDSPKLSKGGKEYSMRGITESNMKTLGFKYGSDLEAIVSKPDPFDMAEPFILDVATFLNDRNQAVSYVRGFESPSRPKEKGNSNVKTLEKAEASEFLRKLSQKSQAKKVVNGSVDIGEIPF